MSVVTEAQPLAWDSSWGPAPKYATPRNPDRKTFGETVAKISALLRRPMFPWQRYVVDVAMEVDPNTGRLFYDQVVVLAPRRAGKTAKVQALAAHRCGGSRRVSAWITAQSNTHAVRRWKDSTADIVDTSVKGTLQQYVSIGNENLIWRDTGSYFRPFNPDEDAMHGEDPDLVFVDELWKFTAAQREVIQQGYRPAWIVKEGQEWLLSAAGGPRSEWLKAARLQGRAEVSEGLQTRTAFFEWGIPDEIGGVPVDEIDDELLMRTIAAHHPRPDIRIQHLESEMASRGRGKILRDYGNIDEETEQREGVIPRIIMRGAGGPELIPPGSRVCIGIHVDGDRREGSVSAAWRDPESGKCRTTLLKRQDGALWLVPAIKFLRGNPQFELGAVIGLGTGPARGELDEIERAGMNVIRVTQTDFPAACNRFSDEIYARTIIHGNEKELLHAVLHTAWRRRAGTGRVFEPDGEEPNTPLISHTMAYWGVDRLPADTTKAYSWSSY